MDLVDGVSLAETVDDTTGISSKVVTDWSQNTKTKNLKPSISIVDVKGEDIILESGIKISYPMSIDTVLSVEDGNEVQAGQVIARIPILSKLQSFFENRWYINSLYYIVFINGSLRLSKFIDKYIETGILSKLNTVVPDYSISSSQIGGKFDKYVVDGVVNLVGWICQEGSYVFRRLQTGLIQNYAFATLAGVFTFVTWFLFF